MGIRLLRILVASLLLALLGCSGEPAPSSSSPLPAPSPVDPGRCPVTGVLEHHDGGPMGGIVVSASASEVVSDTLARRVGLAHTTSAADGSFSLELACGARVHLEFEGWTWAIHPAALIAEPAPAPLQIRLMSARTVRLWVAGDPGKPAQGARFVPKGGGPALPVPFEGLQLEGIPYGRVAGTIEAEGRPPRTWRLSRSDDLEEIGPMVFEATVHMGESAPLWVEVPEREAREIVGAWCVQDASRAERCILRDGGWHCPCDEQRVAVAAERWDVGVARDVVAHDLEFDALPEAVEQCLTVPGAQRLRVQPAGVNDVALLGKRGPGAGFCLRLPRGEAVDVFEDIDGGRTFRHTADEPGDVTLQ
jgi:hypothetical protein